MALRMLHCKSRVWADFRLDSVISKERGRFPGRRRGAREEQRVRKWIASFILMPMSDGGRMGVSGGDDGGKTNG